MLKIETGTENKILRTKSDTVKPHELRKFRKLWEEMVKYIKDPKNGGVGLAAPQVWVNKQMIVVSLMSWEENEKYSTIFMINPEIIEYSKECEANDEWCLSLPWYEWMVERSVEIKVKFINKDLKEKVLILQWLSARIVQHEFDHLQGILFIDRVK